MKKQPKQPLESTLQDLIYSVDIGKGLTLTRTILFCLLIFITVIIFTAREFRGFDNKEAMDYAQLGRTMAQSNRYQTQCVRPVSMAQIAANTMDGNARIEHHPELFKPPLYPAILAANFKFFNLIKIDLFPSTKASQKMQIYPAERWVIVPLNHLFTILSGLFIYLLGCKLFSTKIGTLSTLTYFLSELVWNDGLHGTGTSLLVFFVLGATYFIVLMMISRRDCRPARRWISLFGLAIIFSTAAFLTHYSAIAMILGLALYILIVGLKKWHGGWMAFSYLLIVFLLISPWLMRNIQLSGQPLGLAPYTALIDSSKYPDDSFMRTLNPNFSFFSDLKIIWRKWIENFDTYYETRIIFLGNWLLITFFVVTFFYRFVRLHVHKLRWGIGLAILLFFIGAGCFGEETCRASHIFWPFVILYGLSFFTILLDRLDFTIHLFKLALIGLIIGLTALPLLVTVFLSSRPHFPYPPYYAPFAMRVSELLEPNEIICSDMPWATAWYGKQTSILLPQTLDDYYEINDYRKYISGLYITTLTRDRPFLSSLLEGPEKTWFPIIKGQIPKDFPLKYGFPINGQDQTFITDRVRWTSGGTKKKRAK